jgi:hypothetical protein
LGLKFFQWIKIMTQYGRHLLFLSMLLSFACFFSLSTNVADLDLWHRLATGRAFIESCRVIQHDIFSYMPVKEVWVDHEWGAGIVFYLIQRSWGNSGLIGLKISLYFVILYLIWKGGRLRSQDSDQIGIIYFLGVAFAVHPAFCSTLRCHAFTYLFFALWIYLLERIRRGEKRLVLFFPLTMLLWINMHGGFVAGFGLLGIYILGSFWNREEVGPYLTSLAITLPMLLLTPYGGDFLVYMFDAVTMPRPQIGEWRALQLFGDHPIWLGFKITGLITLIGYAWQRRQGGRHLDKILLLLLGITLFLGIRHRRHTIFFMIAVAIFGQAEILMFFRACWANIREKYLTHASEKFWRQLGRRASWLGYLLWVALFLCTLASSRPDLEIAEPNYPVRSVQWIKDQQLSGHLLTDFNWGSYALWQLYPACLVAIDGRFEETYSVATYEQIDTFFAHGNSWDRILSEQPPDLILINRGYQKTALALQARSDWSKLYEDEVAILFISRAYLEKMQQEYQQTLDFSAPIPVPGEIVEKVDAAGVRAGG